MRNYMRKYREKQKMIAEGECKTNSKTNSKTNVSSLEGDIEGDIDIERDIEGDIEDKEEVSSALTAKDITLIIKAWNTLGLQQLRSINNNTNRYTMLKARVKEYSVNDVIQAIESIDKSSFLKGQNKRNWTITFDWFIRPNNFLKVLEGNYLDRGTQYGTVGSDNGSKPITEGERLMQLAKEKGLLDNLTVEEVPF